MALAPRACAAVDPHPVAAAPCPRRVVAEVPRSREVAVVPRSVAAVPWSREWATAGPLCGQAAASMRPRGGSTSKAGEQAAPVDVRVATTTHEARGSSERRHERDDRAWHPPIRRSLGGPSDDLHLCLCHRRCPPATTSSDSCFLFDYCVLFLPHVLFTLKTVWFYAWTRSSYISLLHAYFLHAYWKVNSLIYDVRNYHKKSNHLCS
jgi:hypothetical protein